MLENKNIRHHQNDAVVVFQHILERSPFSPVLASGGKNATAPWDSITARYAYFEQFHSKLFSSLVLTNLNLSWNMIHSSTTRPRMTQTLSQTTLQEHPWKHEWSWRTLLTKLCKYIPSPMYLVDQEPTKEIVGGQRSKPEFASDTFWHQNNTTTNPEHYSKRLWKMDDSLCWQLQFVSSFEATELTISQKHILAYPSFKTLGEF